MVTVALALDSTPSKGIQEQTGFYFVFLQGNMVGFVTWFLLVVKSASHPAHSARPAAAMSNKLHKLPPASFCFLYLPGPLSKKDE